MQALLGVSAVLDRILRIVAGIGAWCGFALMLVVCFDVATRYLGVPKPFGLNSTQVQEFEYWLHTFLFALILGYAYTRQSHVRIDLVRDRLKTRTKYLIEIIGCVIFLLTYSALGTWLTWKYAYASFLEDEVSKSTIGLSNIWILKGALVAMFVLLAMAGVSQLIKAIAGYRGQLPQNKVAETLGGDS